MAESKKVQSGRVVTSLNGLLASDAPPPPPKPVKQILITNEPDVVRSKHADSQSKQDSAKSKQNN